MGEGAVKRKRVVVLGSTGSIGTSALKVASDIPDRMEVIGIAAHQSVEAIAKQATANGIRHVGLSHQEKATELASQIGGGHDVYAGEDGLVELATLPDADMVLIAIVGTAGLRPALAALEAGKDSPSQAKKFS